MGELQFETVIEIDAPVSRVWAVLSDFDRTPSWNPYIRSIKGKAVEGSQFKLNIGPPGGPGLRVRCTVLRVRPERELRWLGRLLMSGIFDGEHYYLLEPIGERRTRVTHGEKLSGFLVNLTRGLAPKEIFYTEMNEALKRESERT